MAPRTEAASAAAAVATCFLLGLSHDEVSIVTHDLCDPLQPLLARALERTVNQGPASGGDGGAAGGAQGAAAGGGGTRCAVEGELCAAAICEETVLGC